MKKLQLVSLIMLGLSVIVWAAGRAVLPLPDWAVRANGAVMLTAMPLLAFSTVRRKVKNS